MKVIDLTLTISEEIPTFPGSPQPNFINWETLEKDGYNLELLFLSSHTGTHIDAPYHFLKKGQKIHQIVTRRLVTEAILIKIRKGANQSITKTDIQKFEKKHGKIPNESTIVFWTGWQKMIKNDSYFVNNPGLSVTAAKYLISKKTNLVGIDSPSIDLGKEKRFLIHHLFAKNDVLIVENLANLDKIKSWKFQLAVLPMKLENATGAPVRAVGIIDG